MTFLSPYLCKTTYFKDVFGDLHDWKKFGVVVANINADFMAPVFFSDELVIETTVVHLGNKSIHNSLFYLKYYKI